jgi:predicted acylesterase/phospholipase RssA
MDDWQSRHAGGAMSHVPELASPDSRRALVLAGGGMRVAYQAGVLRAFAEDGLTFFHGDGASGGTINLAMLLSGLTAEEMCERWATLDVKDFVSLLPLRRYLRGPSQLAYGDADGLVQKVFPHLGIDIERIRAAQGMEGTFNVVDYGSKTNHAIPHTELDLDLLVAGVSLPMMLPPVAARGRLWTDAVWIKDANLLEAARRGAEELWLVWCIGNTNVYRRGLLNQYVHMIELSANGSVAEELERIEAGPNPPALHVVKPEFPIPLDPDLFLGRISARSLTAMGYRDSRRYLDTRTEAGVARDWTATKMRDPGRAVAFVERWRGEDLWLEVRVELPDVDAGPAGLAAGWLAAPSRTVAHGVYDGSGYALTYAADGSSYELELERTGRREGLAVVRGDGSVVLETPVRREGLVRRVHATSADTLAERVGTTLRFLRTGRTRRAASL